MFVQAIPLHTFALSTVQEQGIIEVEVKVNDEAEEELASGSYELHLIESAPLLEVIARNLFISRIDGRRIYAVLTDAAFPSRHGTVIHLAMLIHRRSDRDHPSTTAVGHSGRSCSAGGRTAPCAQYERHATLIACLPHHIYLAERAACPRQGRHALCLREALF